MYTQAQIKTAFDEELGDSAGLFTLNETTRWFNDGQARLEWYRPQMSTLSWTAGALTVALPADFALADKLVLNSGVADEGWEQHGTTLHHPDSTGASAAGQGRLFYWAYWPDVDGANPSLMPRGADAACIYYAISRAYAKLSGSRAYYKRYATMLGANAVGMEDLRRLADEAYEDFVEAKADLPAFRG